MAVLALGFHGGESNRSPLQRRSLGTGVAHTARLVLVASAFLSCFGSPLSTSALLVSTWGEIKADPLSTPPQAGVVGSSPHHSFTREGNSLEPGSFLWVLSLCQPWG